MPVISAPRQQRRLASVLLADCTASITVAIMDSRVVLLLCCFLALGATSASAQQSSDVPTSFERFFDAVVQGILKKYHDALEPYHLEDLEIIVQPSIAWHKLPPKITVHATNNTLFGFSSIHRTGHASAEMQASQRLTTVQMAVGPLNDTSDLDIKIFGLHLRPKIEINIKNLDFTLAILGDKVAKKLTTKQFKVNRLEGLKIKVKTCCLTDRVNNLILNRILPLLERKIRQELEETVKSHLDDKLQDLPEDLKRLLYG